MAMGMGMGTRITMAIRHRAAAAVVLWRRMFRPAWWRGMIVRRFAAKSKDAGLMPARRLVTGDTERISDRVRSHRRQFPLHLPLRRQFPRRLRPGATVAVAAVQPDRRVRNRQRLSES